MCVGVEKDSGLYGEAIPDDVWEYVEKNCRDAIKIAIDAEAIDIDITENSQIYVMKPYIIVGTEESQNAVYKFPFVLNDKVFMILTVTNTTEGFKMNFGENISEKLNGIDYLKKDYVFYENAKNIVAECENKSEVLYTYEPTMGINQISEEVNYRKLSFDDKVEDSIEKITSFKPCNMETFCSIEENLYHKMSRILQIKNKCAQYQYGMCWAAAGTVINYKLGRNVNAFDICNRMGIGYNEGGSIFDIRAAMEREGLVYSKIRADALSTKEIKENIDKSNPIIAGMDSTVSNAAHALVIYGYETRNNKEYITYWNPYDSGTEKEVAYPSVNPILVLEKEVYVWKRTLSKL